MDNGELIEGIVYKNDSEYCRFTDKILSKTHLVRTIGNTSVHIIQDKIAYLDTESNSKLIEKGGIDLKINTQYGVFDIETALSGNKDMIHVSSVWMADGIYKSYFVTDYESAYDMFQSMFSDMLEMNGYTWYAHNLGNFDSAFVMKVLNTEYKDHIKILYKEIYGYVIEKKTISVTGLLYI